MPAWQKDKDALSADELAASKKRVAAAAAQYLRTVPENAQGLGVDAAERRGVIDGG
jgi:hypothetical protein